MNANSHPEGEPPWGTSGWAGQVKATARSFLAYLQVRAQLFALECREAAQLAGRHFAVILLASVLLFMGYTLLTVSLIDLLSSALRVRWVWPALILAAVHFAGGSVLWWFAQTRLKHPLFEATLKELEKDQEWISRNVPSHPKRRN